jgi:hypothetical protein
MSNIVTHYVSRDKTLDYLFQESVEEQFESLRESQERPAKKNMLASLFAQWFRGGNGQQDPYDDYLANH